MRQSTTLREIIDTVEYMSTFTDDILRQYSLFFIASFRGSFRLLYSKYYLSLCEAVSLYTDPHIKAIYDLHEQFGERDSSYNLIYEKNDKGVILTDTIYVCIRVKRAKIKEEHLDEYNSLLHNINTEYAHLTKVIESYLAASITVELMKIEKEWLPSEFSQDIINKIKLIL